MSQRVFFLIATLSICIGLLGLGGFFQSKQSTASEITYVTYQIAQLNTPIKKGEKLRKEDVRYLRLSEEDALKSGILRDVIISHVPGMVAERNLSTNENISQDDFLFPNDPDYLNAVIGDGMTPYSLTIEYKNFLGSGISVGDYVDVIILTSDEQNIGDTSKSKFIESIRSLSVSPLLQNVRVLAIEDDEEEIFLPLTIELNREQVAKMVIARRIGILEVIKSSDYPAETNTALNADTHDVLPNYKSVTEIRGQKKAYN